MSIENKISQKLYWDDQHKKREQEFAKLETEPNPFARECLKYIKPGGKILEIGIANGRDARYFARENENTIVGVDISTEAIRQLIEAAIRDNTIDKILPVVSNINDLPTVLAEQEYYDAFYSRSALHLDDEDLQKFFEYLVSHLQQNGIIMVQGKIQEDNKIKRSTEIGKNCFEDIDGHIRRVWSQQYIEELCTKFQLEILETGFSSENWQNKETKFIHFIARKK